MIRFIIFLFIGLISGWLAGEIVVGDGFGLIGNLIVGLIGAFVGGLILDLFGENAEDKGLVVSILTSTLGAVVFLFLVNLIF